MKKAILAFVVLATFLLVLPGAIAGGTPGGDTTPPAGPLSASVPETIWIQNVIAGGTPGGDTTPPAIIKDLF